MPYPANLMLLLSSAEEKPVPVIDIDGTVFVQFVLFLVMYFVLKRLLFGPYLEMQKQRSAGIEGARAEAEAMEKKAQDLEKDYERRFASARVKAEEERVRLRSEGQERERDLLTEARSVAQLQMNAAKRKIDTEVSAARAEMAQKAQPLARQIASKVLGREV